jgi:hypothetical protein
MAEKSDTTVHEDTTHAQHSLMDDHIAIHTETYDIDVDALGTNLPKRYYWSPGFIGTVVVSSALVTTVPVSKLIWLGFVSRKHLKLLGMGTAIELAGVD